MSVDLQVSFWPRDRESLEKLITTLIEYGYKKTPEFPLNTDTSDDPWSWAFNPNVKFLTFHQDSNFTGFLVARQLPNNIHIHALWIPPSARGSGIGSQILSSLPNYFRFVPKNTTVTLHAYCINDLAKKFYLKCGFVPFNDSSDQEIQGISQWIEHASFQWPLASNKMCYWKYLNG